MEFCEGYTTHERRKERRGKRSERQYRELAALRLENRARLGFGCSMFLSITIQLMVRNGRRPRWRQCNSSHARTEQRCVRRRSPGRGRGSRRRPRRDHAWWGWWRRWATSRRPSAACRCRRRSPRPPSETPKARDESAVHADEQIGISMHMHTSRASAIHQKTFDEGLRRR